MSEHLLHAPHHDGSPLYVSVDAPALDELVTVFVRVPHDRTGAPGATAVSARALRDGEPAWSTAEIDRTEADATWWRAQLQAVNPVTSYRFLLSGPPGSTVGPYAWLNGTGLHTRDVTDRADFRLLAHPGAPDWVGDAIVYQVFPDRFARSEQADQRPLPAWAVAAGWDDEVAHIGPLTGTQLFGGDLAGIAQHLDHLIELGATVLYLTPCFPAQSNHRYDAATFDHVDPVLGGDAAFTALVQAAHARGLRVMGDLTTNHTGDAHEWFRAAQADKGAPEAGFYFFDQHPDRYDSWLGVASLPKLDQSCPELRSRLYDGPGSVVARWLRAGLDAWRIDVANMTGRHGTQDLAHDVARTLTATARAARPDVWVLAEHGHDAAADLCGDGWHGVMDYAGFTRPVWTWLSAGDDLGRAFFGSPATVPSLPASAVVTTMREVHAEMPWRAQVASSLHLDSHDVARFRTAVGGGSSGGISTAGRDRHLAGLALQMTLPGVPTMFAGDEIGLTGVDGEHARTPFPWHRRQDWDEPTLQAYRTWAQLRRQSVALRRGGLRWVHADSESMTYLREHATERVLVHVARAEHPPVTLPLYALGISGEADVRLLHGSPACTTTHGLVLPVAGPAASVYLLG